MKRFFAAMLMLAAQALQAQAPDLENMDLVQKSTPAGPVATVDGQPIDSEEFLGLYLVQMKELMARAGAGAQITDQIRLEAAIQCVRQLIRERILLSEAKKRGLTVSDAEVEAEYNRQFTEMQADLQEQANKALTEQEFLQQIGKSRQEVLADAKRGMTIEKARDAILQGKDTHIPDADVKAFYEKNPERFGRPGGVHIKQIFVKPAGAGPKDWEAADKEIKEALGKLQSGSTFEAVARDYSDSPDKANGGHILVASMDNLPPFYQSALQTMKPGDLSGIIKSEHGYHVIYYVENKGEEKVTLEQAEDRIRGVLTRVKEEDILDDYLRPIELDPQRVIVYLDFEKNLPESMRQPAPAQPKPKS